MNPVEILKKQAEPVHDSLTCPKTGCNVTIWACQINLENHIPRCRGCQSGDLARRLAAAIREITRLICRQMPPENKVNKASRPKKPAILCTDPECGCGRPVVARGLCNARYKKWWNAANREKVRVHAKLYYDKHRKSLKKKS